MTVVRAGRAGCTGGKRRSAEFAALASVMSDLLMIGGFVRKHLFLSASLSVLGAPLAAQDVEENDEGLFTPGFRVAEETITVTATGTRTEIDDTGQAITAIVLDDDLSEGALIQGADLTRALERVPSLTFSRNGGAGGFTGVRLRGAEAEQTLLIIDGVRVADPASPGGGFDFGNLLTPNLEKLDILRGSNSTIWGSDAIGGVIVATTRAESGLRGSAEYGARDTATANLSGGVSSDSFFVGGSASYYRTDGFSSAAVGTEADAFEQWAVNGQARYYVSDRFEVFARGRWAEGDLEIDGFPFPTFTLSDTDETQDTRQYSGNAGLVFDDSDLFLAATYSFADTERVNLNPAFGTAPSFTSDGHSDRVDLRGEWRPIGPLLVHFGGEHEWTSYETLFSAPADTRIFGAYGQLGIEFGDWSAHAGTRFDDHARFGSELSFGADVSYRINYDIRLRASVGEGFKAPTLFQLFSDFGNEGLQPEQSTSVDVGVEFGDRSFRRADLHAALTLFHRDTQDQIEFVSCFGATTGICTNRPFGTFDNVGRVRAQGFEVELGAQPSQNFTARAVYAFIDTENRTVGSFNEGNDLARRPRHALTVSADWETPVERLIVGGDIRMVGDSFDDAGNFTRLDGYAVGTVRVSWQFNENLTLFGRVENVTDAQYQTAAGYATPGRGAFVGIRAGL